MTAHIILRARTAAAHATIDAAFSQFDLCDRDSYTGFLRAHARVVPAIEAVLTDAKLPLWRARTIFLQKDLEALGRYLPEQLGIEDSLNAAQKWGLLYILEGSRLGGRLLMRRVTPGFPLEYLSAGHEPDEWRNFIQLLNDRASFEDSAWLEGVLNGALLGFKFYAQSASEYLMGNKPT